MTVTENEFEAYRNEQEEKQKAFQVFVKCRMRKMTERMHELEDQMVMLAALSTIAVVASVSAVVISLVV